MVMFWPPEGYGNLHPNLFTGWQDVPLPYTAPQTDAFVSTSALWKTDLRWEMTEDTSVHYNHGTEALFPQPPIERSVQYPTMGPHFPRDEVSKIASISQNEDITARGKVSTPSVAVFQ